MVRGAHIFPQNEYKKKTGALEREKRTSVAFTI